MVPTRAIRDAKKIGYQEKKKAMPIIVAEVEDFDSDSVARRCSDQLDWIQVDRVAFVRGNWTIGPFC